MARPALRTHEFEVLLRLLQQDQAVRVGSHRDLHRFLHGVPYLLRTGIPWRDLPRRFEHGNSLFRRWCQIGVWKRLVAACAAERGQPWRVHLDTTHVRAYPVAAGAGVPKVARTGKPKAVAGVASAPCAAMYRPRIRWGLRIRAVIHPGSTSSLSSTSLNLRTRSGMW
ncbi:MAG: transposase [Caldilineaceae bacterium]|nr:transposase [Caldilineaceae bacterium]